ncbi:restriction endonuclease subunit S [Vibrio artabrorum]|uniref:restriction endonuclease subunit S n=1 Tax=Vibrio artabrorum TaxID=446374 RepID=UPI00354C4CE0
MTEQMNVPDLRFGEFGGTLTTIPLEKLTTKISDGIHSTPAYDNDGDYFFVNGNNLKNGVIQLDEKTKKVSAEEAKKHHKYIDEQTILMSINGTIGNTAFYRGEPIMLGKSASYINVAPLLADKHFIFNYLQREATKYYFNTELTGSTIKNLSLKAIKNTPIASPTLPEQQKIASFLSKVDEKIGLLSEKKDKLTEYKRGVMQQLFNGKWHEQDGQLTFAPPTLRFKADDGSEFPDWEEKTLGEVAQFSKGKGISKADIIENGQVSCVRYGELYTTYSEVIDTVYSKTNQPKDALVLSRANDVIIPSSGEAALDIATASCVLHSGIALSGDLTIIRSQIDGVFLSFQLNTVRKHELASIAQGSSVIHLYSSHLKNVTVSIPDIQEQKKITKFLSAIDKKIELINSELNKAKEWKKGLLQQMFV